MILECRLIIFCCKFCNGFATVNAEVQCLLLFTVKSNIQYGDYISSKFNYNTY